MDFEEFTIDPVNDEFLDPHEYFEDFDINNTNIGEAILEASQGASQKNILSKIWSLLKKLFNFIINAITKLIKFIVKIFNKTRKSILNVFDDMGLKVKQIAHFGNNRYKRINLPKHRLSKINPGDSVDAPINPIKIKFDEDKKVVLQILPFVKFNVPIAGNLPSGAPLHQMVMVLESLEDDKGRLDNIIKIYENLKNIIDNKDSAKDISNGSENRKMIDKLYKEIETYTDSLFFNSEKQRKILKSAFYVKFDLEKLKQFNVKLQKASEIMSSVDIDKLMNIIDPYKHNKISLSNALNSLAQYLTMMQMGINMLTTSLKEIYDIPAEYIGAISDMETLSKFAEKMIKYGFPSKYVMLNVYLISDEKLRGSDKSGNENKPIWGQSRVCFLPEKKMIVHKIAINGFGLSSNVMEEKVYKLFKDAGRDNILAPITYISSNKYALDMQRAETLNFVDGIEAAYKIQAKIMSALNEINKSRVNAIRIDDIHPGNVAKIGDRLVAIDYGL